MSINTIGGNATPSDPRSSGAQSGGNRTDNNGPDNRPAGNSSADTVNISTSAGDLQAMEARLAELPEVDRGRVTELRSQIASGEYQIDSQQVADRLLAFESDL
ncbi:MAG: flagellar biosynthesis anti-sigma factor FlgM [Pseudomonadota bacterium]